MFCVHAAVTGFCSTGATGGKEYSEESPFAEPDREMLGPPAPAPPKVPTPALPVMAPG